MNDIDEYKYVMEDELSNKDRFFRFAELTRVDAKEKPETWAAITKFRRYIKKNSIVAEIGAGHGLLGTWLAWMGLNYSVLYDERYSIKPPVAYKLALKFKPYLAKFIKIKEQKLSSDNLDIEADSIIGVHCCGDLTDFALRAAVKRRIPVAVMTCCHNKKRTGVERCNGNMNIQGLNLQGRLGIDINRASWLSAQGYKVSIKKIPQYITGEPTIIMGTPV